MTKKTTILAILCIFMLGWLSSSLFAVSGGLNVENPFSFSVFDATELESPYNHVEKDQIHVYSDRIVLDIEDARWAEFTNTNSMDPILDEDANSIEIMPESVDDVHVGDIIVYQPRNFNGLIIHRVVEIGQDGDGWFAIVKGDNLNEEDPDKVRFNQIEGILVGIIY